MEKNKLVTLKLIGFNEDARNSFSAVLTLASRALKKKWQITEADEADFFLLSPQSSATANREQLLKGLFAERCLFCSTDENTTQENELYLDSSHTPSLSMLATLLNKVSATENLTSRPKAKAAEVSSQISSSSNLDLPISQAFFDPEQGLLSHLLAAKSHPLIISLVSQPQYPALYIDAEKNTYYSKNTLAQLESYFANSETLGVKPASKVEMHSHIKLDSLKPLPLKALIWYIVMKSSTGRLLKNHSATTDIVSMKGWPDLRYFKCLEYVKVATFMKNNAATLEIIASHTEMPLENLNDFYNACHVLGLIEHKSQIEINKKNISEERLNLLNNIDARLKIE